MLDGDMVVDKPSSNQNTYLGNLEKCPYCYNFHPGVCPKVKEMEFHPNGTLKRVVFFDQTDYQKK